jgi:NAD(P)-dependent dehydrogenase (short-subunit alcohol dehydrogenase family)
VLMLAQSIALDHAGQGIRANCICPGYLESVMSDRAAEMSGDMKAARARRATETVPLGRQGTYAEAAKLVLMLSDPEVAGYITGTALTMDGGILLA